MPKIDALPDGSSHQRHNLNHQAIEDYLKTIYTLAVDEKGTHIMSTPGGRAQFNLGRERDAVSR